MCTRLISIIVIVLASTLIGGCGGGGSRQSSQKESVSPSTRSDNTISPQPAVPQPSEKESVSPKGPVAQTIDYQVLKESHPALGKKGGIGMDILVDESATKEEVMALASRLRARYHDKDFIWINIFDSRDDWADRENMTKGALPRYSEKDFYRHFLVDITKNEATGLDKINWVAEGRDH